MVTMDAHIQKWGNGLALRVAGMMRDIPGFEEGTPVTIDITEEGFVVRRASPYKKLKFPYTEKELLQGLKPSSDDHELLAPLTDEEWPPY